MQKFVLFIEPDIGTYASGTMKPSKIRDLFIDAVEENQNRKILQIFELEIDLLHVCSRKPDPEKGNGLNILSTP